MSEKMLSELPVLSQVTSAHELLTWLGNNAAGRMPISVLTNLMGIGIVDASLNNDGYVKFANGLIIQWMRVNTQSQNKVTEVTLPIPFTTKCFASVVTALSYDSAPVSPAASAVDTATAYVVSSGEGFGYQLIAIGY